MRILILGGTGPSGVLLIEALLAQPVHHTIVVYARNPQKLPTDVAQHADVTVIQGELTDEEALSGAMRDVNIVLSALGPAPGHPGGNILAKAFELVFALMKRHSVPRIILLATPSVVDENDRFSLVYKALILGVSLFAGNAYRDIVAVGKVVDTEGEGIEWTVVRVPILNDADKTEVVAGYVGDGKLGYVLSRKGFAAFVVKEMNEKKWIGKRPAISSA
ncbi:NAD(P)-binding protein [Amylostereum chailletii]|nr:NAD(P)-binding protein [Amylostereum chailletii]